MQKLSEGSHLAGKYHIQSLVDARPYCVRYTARDSVLQGHWVIKQFEIPRDEDQKKEFLNHFYAEGERESEISIEQLPRVEEFFAEKGCAWTVTEFIEGRSLKEVIEARGGQLSEDEVRQWIVSVASALQFLHGQEPRMVLGGFDWEEFTVTPEGVIRLRDYGMPRIYPPARRTEIPLDGLPRWYDSEMLRNAKATRQADIWSLGALAYYMLTGVEATHEGRKPLKKLREDVSDAFSAIVEKCLEPFGESVYHAIEEVVDDLSGRPSVDITVPPRLTVVPPRLVFNNVTPGAVAIENFRIVNEGGGTLAGHVHSAVPWLQVSPQHFEGNDQEMQVWIDTAILHEDTRAKGDILVTSANEEIRLPVTLELNLGKVGGLSPAAASAIMLLIACVPLGLLSWFNAEALRAAGEYLTQHPGASAGAEGVPEMVRMRSTGTVLLFARLLFALLIPVGVYLVWRTLAAGARRRTTLMAAATMLLPALVSLVAMRSAENKFASQSVAMWLHLSPNWGGWWTILGTVVAAVMLLTPGSKYPFFFRYSYGLRVLLAAVLFMLYAWRAYALLAGSPG